MKKIFFLVSIIPLLLISATVNAAPMWYIGGGYGRSHVDLDSSAFNGAPSISRWSTGGKAYVGYKFNDYLAVDGTFIQFGKVDATGVGFIRTYSVIGSGVMMYPVTKNINLGAKAGLFWVKYRLSPNLADSYRTGVTDPVGGLGFAYGTFAQYMIEQNAYVFASWDQLVSRGSRTALKLKNGIVSVGLEIQLADTYT